VSDFAASVIPWLHPALGLAAVALLLQAARRGLDIRRRVRSGRAHPKLAMRAWWFIAANWLLGLWTVGSFREDLELATSSHFLAGTALLVLLSIAGLSSRWIDADPRMRRIHPVIGAVALLLAGVQLFLGLQMTRW